MKAKVSVTALSLIVLLAGGCGPDNHSVGTTAGKSSPESSQSRELINIGDSQQHVDKILGEPSIEFPDGNKMIRWYTGYEVTSSNNVVVSVKRTPDKPR
jgi:hypothetical protein